MLKQYPDAYVHYLRHFHQTRDFFECHELLEEYWKENPDNVHKDTWVGLIQLAVALYHERRGNLRGAQKMLESGTRILEEADLVSLGINKRALIEQLKQRLTQYADDPVRAYQDMDIPVTDAALIQYVGNAIKSTQIDPYIVHKHTRRDRTDVISARNRELMKKKRLQSGKSE